MVGKILFLSNGFGEDAISCYIIEELRKLIDSSLIWAFPLVGEGKAYKEAEIEVVESFPLTPSGGMVAENYIKNIWIDLKGGLISITLRQINILKQIKEKVLLTVAVGDIFPVVMGGLFVKKNLIFVGTAKSNFFDPYNSIEKSVFKRFCQKVFARDVPTAEDLKGYGIDAEWVGNAMMDGINLEGSIEGLPKDKTIIALLFGSRDFAYSDFPIIMECAKRLASQRKDVVFVSPLAPSISLDVLEKLSSKQGLSLKQRGKKEGIVATIEGEKVKVFLTRNVFGESIKDAYIVIGQAGTGNEQAAGIGKPIVAFDSSGKKNMGWYRKRQKGLLGDALAVVDRDSNALYEKVIEIMSNKDLYRHMSSEGKKRMGGRGGALKMAKYIYKSYQSLISKEEAQSTS